MSEAKPSTQEPQRSSARRSCVERTCVACGAKKPQRELLRVASQSGSTPVVDVSGKAKGRGAYLCFDAACAERALKRRAFERALKLKNPAPPELMSTLQTALNDMIVGTITKNAAER